MSRLVGIFKDSKMETIFALLREAAVKCGAVVQDKNVQLTFESPGTCSVRVHQQINMSMQKKSLSENRANIQRHSNKYLTTSNYFNTYKDENKYFGGSWL